MAPEIYYIDYKNILLKNYSITEKAEPPFSTLKNTYRKGEEYGKFKREEIAKGGSKILKGGGNLSKL